MGECENRFSVSTSTVTFWHGFTVFGGWQMREALRGTSLIRNSPLVGPYSRTMSRALWWPKGGGVFLMSEVPLYLHGLFRGTNRIVGRRLWVWVWSEGLAILHV